MCNPSQSLVEGWSLKVIGEGDMAGLSQQPSGDSGGIRMSEEPLSKFFVGYSFTLKFEDAVNYIVFSK